MEGHPDAPLKVYAVWLDMLLSDDRTAVDTTLMPDARVTHYWDGERALGTWFSQQDEYESVTFGPVAWDTFFLYGPAADWTDMPPELIASGRTIISHRGVLMRNLLPLLSEVEAR